MSEMNAQKEDVVDRQRLFDQVAGDELKRGGIGDLAPQAAVEVPPETAGKGQRDADPDHRPDRGFPEADAVLLAAADQKQVDRQHDENDGCESGPQPRVAYGFHKDLLSRIQKSKRPAPEWAKGR